MISRVSKCLEMVGVDFGPESAPFSIHLLFPILELVVHLVEVFHSYAVSYHLQWIDLALLNALQEVFPVEVDGSLAVTDESNASLHHRADVEVIGETNVDTGNA